MYKELTRKTGIALGIGIIFGLQILVFIYLSINMYWVLLIIFILFIISQTLEWNKESYIAFLIGIFIGLIKIFFWNPNPPEILSSYYEKYIEAEGEIMSFPERKGSIMIYDININKLDNKEIDIGLRVTVDQHIKFIRGDRVIVKGKIEKAFESNEFSYKRYLSMKDIHAIMKYPKIIKITNEGIFWKALGGIRYSVQEHISKVYNYPYGGFLEGLLLGRKYGLSDELSDTFQVTGLTHIIAISGYNITLIIMIFSNIFSFLGRYGKVVACIIAVSLFTILVGAEAAVIRACFMGIIGLMGLFYGRQVFVWSTLLWAIVIMTYMEPRTFLFDVGFQLSVVATIGVVALSKKCAEFFKFLPDIFEIRESFSLTIAAQITTLPLLIYYFHNISIVSPIANVIVGPFLPWAMLFGFFELIFSFIPVIGELLYFFTESILKITVFLAEISSKIPYAQIEAPYIKAIFIIITYIGIFILLAKKKIKQPF